jgi:hypothetical protein
MVKQVDGQTQGIIELRVATIDYGCEGRKKVGELRGDIGAI